MSWSITSIGPRAAVYAEVTANQTMPESIKAAIGEIINNPNSKRDSAFVMGHGHQGGDDWSTIGNLNVYLFNAAVLPQPPQIPASAPTTGVAPVPTEAVVADPTLAPQAEA